MNTTTVTYCPSRRTGDTVTVAYTDSTGRRSVRTFHGDAIKARRFYRQMYYKGREPKVVPTPKE